MQIKVFIVLMSFFLSLRVMAQDDELRCFISTKLGQEIQLPKNEMKTPPDFPHLKGQSFQKVVKLQDGSTASFIFTLRFKGAKSFDFRNSSIDMKNALHITAALDDQDMFQYTNYGDGVAVLCTKDHEIEY